MTEPAHVKVLYGRTLLDQKAAAQLTTMFHALADDRDVRAVVLAGQQWCCEPGVAARPIVEACAAVPQPVIAAIGGDCFEEGLELALACDIRVASPGARFRCDHVGMGRTPSAGATQRLPRLAGMALAAQMCAGGEPLTAREAERAGIIDRIVDQDLLPAAIAFAREVIQRGGPPRHLVGAAGPLAHGPAGVGVELGIPRHPDSIEQTFYAVSAPPTTPAHGWHG